MFTRLPFVYVPPFCLRWYGTPCNIFKDNRILKKNYNHGFKNFKIYNICPKNPFIKFHKRDKKQNRCMIRTRDPQIASLPFNQLISKIVQIIPINKK